MGNGRTPTGPQPTLAAESPASQPVSDSAPVSRAEFSQVMDALTKLTTHMTISPEQQEAWRVQTAEANAVSQSTSKSKVWKGIKWAAITLIGGTTLIFGLGAGYQKAIGNNATKSDVKDSMEIHRTEDFAPLKKKVNEFKAEMKPVQEGVKTLVDDRNKEQEVKKAKRKLKRHEKEHLHALEEYAADKAAGRRAGRRPTKTPDHINLEAEIEELEDKL